jgi:hypothetical protein
MTDLTTWLLERIAEDEAAARAAQPGTWAVEMGNQLVAQFTLGEVSIADYITSGESAAHIARHDPARVLAQCAALRAAVELHGGDYDGACMSPAHLDGSCPTLRALASIYADHPEFDPEWRLT